VRLVFATGPRARATETGYRQARPPMSPLPSGRIKESPEDFVVEEIPAYAPSGTGEHVFVRFTKRDRTTLDAVRAVARALDCDPRAAGFAGMKDKRAVATQTLSLQAPRGTSAADLAARAAGLAIDGITVHEATPHPHKMKAGHLAGNRFAIVVRDVPEERAREVTTALERIGLQGVPNAFGAQRFGSRGDNAERALAWLRGEERAPRDPRVLRLLWSSLQSAVFNAVLDARVGDGTWLTALEGDLLKLRSSGGLFGCSDVQTDGPRVASGEVSPTGPILGARMRWPEGRAAELERSTAARILGDGFDLGRTRSLGEGSRRALRLWVQDLRWESVKAGSPTPSGKPAACVRVYFVLPKGSYATTVLATAVALEEGRSTDGEPPADEEETDGAIAT
jgi:tRNA pseudouridine13 synthase